MTLELWQGKRITPRAKLKVGSPVKKDLYPELVGNAVVVSDLLVDKDIFTSWQIISFDVIINEGESLTREIPYAKEDISENLDQRGIVKVGTKVKSGDILAGKKRPYIRSEYSAEEMMLKTIFGEKDNNFKNSSFTYPYQDYAIVLEIEQVQYNLIRVVVGIKRKLQIGDILEDRRKNRYIVSQIAHLPKRADILISGETKLGEGLSVQKNTKLKGERRRAMFGEEEFRKITMQVEEKWQARSVGTYSYITMMPLGEGANPGQKIKQDEINLMAQAGLVSNLAEIFSLKSGHCKNRVEVYEQILRGNEIKISGISEVVVRFVFLLRGLGINTIFIAEDDSEYFLEDLQAEIFSAKIEKLRLEITTEEDIFDWSNGEVKNPETYNHRTLEPEQNGLFCQKIFGPVNNYECACGKYKRIRFNGVICEKCGVEVTHSTVRRRRMGHIALPVELVNPIFIPLIAKKLKIRTELVRQILSYDAWFVTDSKKSLCIAGEIIKKEELEMNDIKAISGAPAIKHLLAVIKVNLPEAFIKNISVIPPEFRPIIRIEGGKYASSDLNDLYRKVINRSNRLRKLIELEAPEIIVRHERAFLQKRVEELFDNNKSGEQITDSNERPLRTLNDELEFTLVELFERRVDYSGTGVVVPDSNLSKGQIGIPKRFLVEIFKPFLMKVLVEKEITENIKLAKKHIDNDQAEIYESLSEIIEGKLVLVSQSEKKPTLSILSPVINDLEAVSLHPETAKDMGIVFSGEKIKIHLPLSQKAQEEARLIFTKEKNLQEIDHDSRLKSGKIRELIDWAIQRNTETLSVLDKLMLGIT